MTPDDTTPPTSAEYTALLAQLETRLQRAYAGWNDALNREQNLRALLAETEATSVARGEALRMIHRHATADWPKFYGETWQQYAPDILRGVAQWASIALAPTQPATHESSTGAVRGDDARETAGSLPAKPPRPVDPTQPAPALESAGPQSLPSAPVGGCVEHMLPRSGDQPTAPAPPPAALLCEHCEGTGYAPNCTRTDRERGDLWACAHCSGTGEADQDEPPAAPRVRPQPEPRYDAVYAEGASWLTREALGEHPRECATHDGDPCTCEPPAAQREGLAVGCQRSHPHPEPCPGTALHIYKGHCPDETQPYSRDVRCVACASINAAPQPEREGGEVETVPAAAHDSLLRGYQNISHQLGQLRTALAEKTAECVMHGKVAAKSIGDLAMARKAGDTWAETANEYSAKLDNALTERDSLRAELTGKTAELVRAQEDAQHEFDLRDAAAKDHHRQVTALRAELTRLQAECERWERNAHTAMEQVGSLALKLNSPVTATPEAGVGEDVARRAIEAWSSDGQGHEQAMKMGRFCVLHRTSSKDEAAALSALFARHLFAIPTCCYWDGETLSLYCGDAGSGALQLMSSTRAMIHGYTARKARSSKGEGS